MDNLCARTKQVDEGTKKLAEEYGSQIRAAVSDPDNQQKAIALVGTAIQIHQQLPGIERRATYRGLKMLGAVPVETPAGRMTLEQAAVQHLTQMVPAPKGTNIEKDPEAAMAALICQDPAYFLTEMKVIKQDGRCVTVTQALAGTQDPAALAKYTAIVEATDRVTHTATTGSGSLEALEAVATAIDAAGAIRN